jgi:formamidopyrimidine-DNA glycosylase
MPELPEVEVVRQGLEEKLIGQKFKAVEVRQSRLRWPIPGNLPELLQDQEIVSVGRRSKYLLLEIPRGWLIVHLGMTGSLVWQNCADFSNVARLAQHDHVIFKLSRGDLVYNDPRRFGAMLWHPKAPHQTHQRAGNLAEQCTALEDFKLFAKLGVEPLSSEFQVEPFFQATRGRSLSIKQFLLAGSSVVGVGNIYCSEALFRAGIRPTRAAGRLSRKQASALHKEIQLTLAEAINKGGSTLRDFVNSEGRAGYFQLDYFAYGRAGLPCKRCTGIIKQIKQQQRSSFYCPSCQS